MVLTVDIEPARLGGDGSDRSQLALLGRVHAHQSIKLCELYALVSVPMNLLVWLSAYEFLGSNVHGPLEAWIGNGWHFLQSHQSMLVFYNCLLIQCSC